LRDMTRYKSQHRQQFIEDQFQDTVLSRPVSRGSTGSRSARTRPRSAHPSGDGPSLSAEGDAMMDAVAAENDLEFAERQWFHPDAPSPRELQAKAAGAVMRWDDVMLHRDRASQGSRRPPSGSGGGRTDRSNGSRGANAPLATATSNVTASNDIQIVSHEDDDDSDSDGVEVYHKQRRLSFAEFRVQAPTAQELAAEEEADKRSMTLRHQESMISTTPTAVYTAANDTVRSAVFPAPMIDSRDLLAADAVAKSAAEIDKQLQITRTLLASTSITELHDAPYIKDSVGADSMAPEQSHTELAGGTQTSLPHLSQSRSASAAARPGRGGASTTRKPRSTTKLKKVASAANMIPAAPLLAEKPKGTRSKCVQLRAYNVSLVRCLVR
jgi:hypothetical protein